MVFYKIKFSVIDNLYSRSREKIANEKKSYFPAENMVFIYAFFR